MKVWQLRSYFNSLPISFDDMEVVYHSGIKCIDGSKIFSSVDFMETQEMTDDEECLLLHNGYIDKEDELEEKAKLN